MEANLYATRVKNNGVFLVNYVETKHEVGNKVQVMVAFNTYSEKLIMQQEIVSRFRRNNIKSDIWCVSTWKRVGGRSGI